MITNIPEKPFYADVIALEREVREKKEEIRQLYKDAKEVESIGVQGVKVLKLAVKRALESAGAKEQREDAEDRAANLLERLGPLADMPLGVAAMQAAKVDNDFYAQARV